MKRQELISSKEYWSTKIALALWTYNGSRDDDFDTYGKMAESIVDDDFIKVLEEYRSQPTESKELPGDEEMKDWAEIHAIHCYHDGLTSKKHFVEGYLYAVDFFKNNYASPLLASKDARIRELEEENKKLSRSIKFCKASINGALDGLQLDNTSDVIEKSTVIEQLNEELKILTPPKN